MLACDSKKSESSLALVHTPLRPAAFTRAVAFSAVSHSMKTCREQGAVHATWEEFEEGGGEKAERMRNSASSSCADVSAPSPTYLAVVGTILLCVTQPPQREQRREVVRLSVEASEMRARTE